MNYKLYFPKENIKQLPLLVFLHGAGERGDMLEDAWRINVHAIPKYISEGMELPALVLCPQCPINFDWNNMVFFLKSLIDEVVEKYGVDKSRISLTGISMGAFGSYEMGALYNSYFSAIAPICGGGLSWRGGDIANTPIWAFHGDADDVVPVKNSIEMIDAISKNGGDTRLTLLHNIDHNSWDFAYKETRVIDWLINSVNKNN